MKVLLWIIQNKENLCSLEVILKQHEGKEIKTVFSFVNRFDGCEKVLFFLFYMSPFLMLRVGEEFLLA